MNHGTNNGHFLSGYKHTFSQITRARTEARITHRVCLNSEVAADVAVPVSPAGCVVADVGGRVFLAMVGSSVSDGSAKGASVGTGAIVGCSIGLVGVGAMEGTSVDTTGASVGIPDGASEGAADGGGSKTKTPMIIPKPQ
mmetsp:Transcript_14136/g.34270  ORF Transcript_14136/g.34270 Transcript_14136/m.34270 type:complete len:140 (-) Transcript_14136:1215-1634(-)